MAAYSYCKYCRRDYREDSSHEIRGCPKLQNNPLLKKQADIDDINEEINFHKTHIKRLKMKLREL